MNKLILVGNGFDLAHGLPTTYRSFLNDFWRNFQLNHNNQEIKNLIDIDYSYNGYFNFGNNSIESFDDLFLNLKSYCKYDSFIFEEEHFVARDKFKNIFRFKSDFFRIINLKSSIQDWVDIENEYYSQLKKVIRLKFGNYQEEKLHAARKEKVIKLNKEFEDLKNLFEKYLLKEICDKFDFKNTENPKEWIEICELLKPIIFSKTPYFKGKISKLSKEFSFQEDEDRIKEYEADILSKSDFEPIIFKSLILSFNYTPTVLAYNNYINRDFGQDICSYNYIHGELKSTKNKINFGFGDEIDSSYKEIENIGDNEYLKNFKSFQYSNTQNYDDLLRYIDSEKFQVYISGHSCGLSDRVLLNTIFEHDNCRSIKVYYHKKDESNNNYTDIVQNISRHFSNKPSMRRKIVNKILCNVLPQNVRFHKN